MWTMMGLNTAVVLGSSLAMASFAGAFGMGFQKVLGFKFFVPTAIF